MLARRVRLSGKERKPGRSRKSAADSGATDWGMAERPVYSIHARRRMAERAISEAEVETVLDQWQTQHADRDGNPVFGAVVAGRRIRVVVAAGSVPPRVITVYF